MNPFWRVFIIIDGLVLFYGGYFVGLHKNDMTPSGDAWFLWCLIGPWVFHTLGCFAGLFIDWAIEWTIKEDAP